MRGYQALSIVVRPLVLVVLFGTAAWISKRIVRRLPNNRLTRYLTRPMHMTPRTEQERKDWSPVLWAWGSWLVLIALIWHFGPH